MQPLTAAAVQVAPRAEPLTPTTVAANVAHAAAWVRRCVESVGADLVVLPESVTTGFAPGCGPDELWDVADAADGPSVDPLREAARDLGISLAWGAYERGPERGVVHNSAVLAGPDGDVVAVYRKTHPFCTELRSRGGWVTPGEEVVVAATPLAAVGMVVCFDGDYPELCRLAAVRGAEILLRPSALLRSADLWELTNRARAYDNHVYVVGANCTGTDPAGTHYFGNSMIVTPLAEVVARAASHECWVSARLDPATAMSSMTPGSSVPQVFDHLADRNLELLRRYADDLVAPARTSFPHPAPRDEVVD